jgi:TolA-binding protein
VTRIPTPEPNRGWRASRVESHRRLMLSWLLLVAALGSSCAFYNTYYLARRYYDRASEGKPYPAEKPDPGTAQNYSRSIDYAKKLIANYPKSKWVDDAHLLWARALLGRDDPRQTVNMLQDFPTRYPNSPLKDEALFYLGVGYRQSRKYTEAVTAFDDFLKRQPKHELAPYAWLERSRALMSLQRPDEAAQSATQLLERFPKSELEPRALAERAEALLAQGSHAAARGDFHLLGRRSRTDQERFEYLLREADALEAARQYDAELTLLRDALSHERAPAVADTSAQIANLQQTGADRYGRLMIRIGTVEALQGRRAEALRSYGSVVSLYPRTPLAAEAQYRIGYVYETLADDFGTARGEYAKVRTHSGSSAFAAQAQLRLNNLERLAQFRTAGGDTVAKQAEAGFLLAEQYLFELGKPDRAITEYRRIARQFPGTPWAAKAMNAEAWVLRRKYQRPGEADSILWHVVRNYPATEAQLAARDYLEYAGHVVPTDLIRLPEPAPAPPPDTARALTPIPESLRFPQLGREDSLARVFMRDQVSRLPGHFPPGSRPDSLFLPPAQRDTLVAPFPRDTARTPAPRDTARTPAPRDTARTPAPRDTVRTPAPAPPDTVRRKP